MRLLIIMMLTLGLLSTYAIGVRVESTPNLGQADVGAAGFFSVVISCSNFENTCNVDGTKNFDCYVDSNNDCRCFRTTDNSCSTDGGDTGSGTEYWALCADGSCEFQGNDIVGVNACFIAGKVWTTDYYTSLNKCQTAGQVCTPNQKLCATSFSLRQCNSEGSGWDVFNCASGEVCTSGGVCESTGQQTQLFWNLCGDFSCEFQGTDVVGVSACYLQGKIPTTEYFTSFQECQDQRSQQTCSSGQTRCLTTYASQSCVGSNWNDAQRCDSNACVDGQCLGSVWCYEGCGASCSERFKCAESGTAFESSFDCSTFKSDICQDVDPPLPPPDDDGNGDGDNEAQTNLFLAGSGALIGAGAGSLINIPFGTIIGGVIGFFVGIGFGGVIGG